MYYYYITIILYLGIVHLNQCFLNIRASLRGHLYTHDLKNVMYRNKLTKKNNALISVCGCVEKEHLTNKNKIGHKIPRIVCDMFLFATLSLFFIQLSNRKSISITFKVNLTHLNLTCP